MGRLQRMLLATAGVAALGFSSCSADPGPAKPDSSGVLHPAAGASDTDCAGWRAKQEQLVRLEPVAASDRTANVDAGVHVSYAEDDRACVELYVWANHSRWTPETVTLTAVDDSGRRWSLSGSVQEVNDSSLVLSPGTDCVRFTGQVFARRGDQLAVWRAEGQSERCS